MKKGGVWWLAYSPVTIFWEGTWWHRWPTMLVSTIGTLLALCLIVDRYGWWSTLYFLVWHRPSSFSAFVLCVFFSFVLGLVFGYSTGLVLFFCFVLSFLLCMLFSVVWQSYPAFGSDWDFFLFVLFVTYSEWQFNPTVYDGILKQCYKSFSWLG